MFTYLLFNSNVLMTSSKCHRLLMTFTQYNVNKRFSLSSVCKHLRRCEQFCYKCTRHLFMIKTIQKFQKSVQISEKYSQTYTGTSTAVEIELPVMTWPIQQTTAKQPNSEFCIYSWPGVFDITIGQHRESTYFCWPPPVQHSNLF